MQGLPALGHSFVGFLSFWPIVYTLGATLVGVLVGCMPGLSATLCIALLTTLTIKLAPNDAILILICSYVGTLYGGSRTAILLNIPGTAANAVSVVRRGLNTFLIVPTSSISSLALRSSPSCRYAYCMKS